MYNSFYNFVFINTLRPRIIELMHLSSQDMMPKMTCSDNEQCLKSKVQRKNTNQEQSKHGHKKPNGMIRCNAGLGILCWPITPAVCGKDEKIRRQLGNQIINYGLAVSIKNVSQHATQCKIKLIMKYTFILGHLSLPWDTKNEKNIKTTKY